MSDGKEVLKTDSAIEKSDGIDEQTPEIVPIDAQININEDNIKMHLSINIYPPQNGGADVTKEKILEAIKSRGVVFGIKEDAVDRLVEQHIYDENIEIAVGLTAVDGIDGVCTELFPRQFVPSFKQRDDGTLDFKEMNIVQNVKKGTAICSITLPTAGTVGSDIYGTTLKAREGRVAIVPQGENTCLNDDKTELVAAIDGSLIFRKDHFCVDSIFTVDGDVDNSVGNITFTGDVVVRGDVQEGYEIHCNGSVIVKGMVEGANIYADGSITLEKGINGMNHGVLVAKKDITSKYVENCTLSAGGNILAESIINCKVETDGSLDVHGKRGIIAGGKCTVFGSVKANAIGSRSASQTVIALGITPSIMKEKSEIEASLKKVRMDNEEMAKSLLYLEKLSKQGQLNTPEKKAMLSKIRMQAPLSKMKEEKLNKQRRALEEQILSVNACVLTCKKIYPPTKISIGNASMVVQDLQENVRVYRNDDGELSVGKC